MQIEVEYFRAATLNNNIAWLKSFGCHTMWVNNVLHIDHSTLPGYNLRLLFGSPETAVVRLETVLAGLNTASEEPEIYIDETVDSPPLRSRLCSGGFEITAINATKVSKWVPCTEEAAITLQRALPSDSEEWISLYSAGFGHQGQEAEYDRHRWRQSFKSRSVHHWFFMQGELKIGICQTCVDSGVVGIYSFTLSSIARGMNKLRPIIRALRAKLTEDGEANVYFERLWKKGWLNKQHIADDPYGFKVIRKMIGYRRY